MRIGTESYSNVNILNYSDSGQPFGGSALEYTIGFIGSPGVSIVEVYI